MSTADDKIASFETGVLLPALAEVCGAQRLLRDYTAEVITQRPSPNAGTEEVLARLGDALRRRSGPSLVLTDRRLPDHLATSTLGRYVMTVFYREREPEVFASPGVSFWMAFNKKLHVFDHRYNSILAEHRVEDVTRPQILNHILNSFDFYKIYALSEQPFPGYR
jgi:hypothetical protein